MCQSIIAFGKHFDKKNTYRGLDLGGNGTKTQDLVLQFVETLLESAVTPTPRTIANSGNSPIVQCYNCNEKVIMLEAVQSSGFETHNFSRSRYVPEDEIEELNATCIVMERIQSVINDPDIDPEFVSEGNTEIIENDTIAHDQHRAEMEDLM
ncbi:hypothetical protein Tco_0525236 [Tanacetum coccineum]